MKPRIHRLEAGELRALQIAWIAGATEQLADGIFGREANDIDAAVDHAVDLFVNQGQQPGNAIARAVNAARRKIITRQIAALVVWAHSGARL